MNEQLVKLKSSINRDVISQFDVKALENYRFVPIDIKDNTLFAVVSSESKKSIVELEAKKICKCPTKFLQIAPNELNDFLVTVVQEMVNSSVSKIVATARLPQTGERKKLGEILIENGVITEVQLIEALAESKKQGMPLGSMLYSMGFINLDQLKMALHQQSGIEVVTAEMQRGQDKFMSMLPEDFIKSNKVIPLSSDGKTIKLGMVDPSDTNVLKDIVYLTGQTPKPYLMTHIEFQNAINKYFSKAKQETKKIMEQVESDVLAYDVEDSIWDQIEKELTDSTGSVAQLVNKIVTDAIEMHASDIHIEPRIANHVVRYRIDGILREVIEIPAKVENAVITRFKVLSRMNIAEHRRPQDGSFSIKYQNKMFDFRINSLPVGGKEKIVIRVLAPPVSFDSADKEIKMDGATERDISIIKKMIACPNGIILTSGPTGSGKTTTLYSLLKVMNTTSVNITTIEDPVEIKLEGVNQSQVNTKAGITFAFCMRAILRQDPDVILVGEIRDYETLEVAISAALTGHLVLSTLHTNSAAATVTRLIEMGAKDYLVSSTLSGVIAQRLVRKLCSCKQEYYPTHDEAAQILVDESDIQKLMKTKLYKPVGCSKCEMSGYKGRLGVFEILPVTKEIKKLISMGAHDIEIEDAAVACGMKTLNQACFHHILQGETTIDEFVRVLGLVNE
ncbi:Flp pilus assembly complex ATPase component TadA [bacterium]|nr:Flp pilus assembly complex ATPase component TadA [bacterium]